MMNTEEKIPGSVPSPDPKSKLNGVYPGPRLTWKCTLWLLFNPADKSTDQQTE